MTLGKRFLGLHLIWDQGEGNTRLVRSILHTVLKCLLIIVWPATLILYLCLGGRMPYDLQLGLCYVQGPKAPLWKTLLKIAAGVVIFFALAFCAASLMLSSVNKEAYYTVRDEKIPSVYTVLGNIVWQDIPPPAAPAFTRRSTSMWSGGTEMNSWNNIWST